MSGESMREMHPLFQVGDGGSTPTSPLQMTVRRIGLKRARALNETWHSLRTSATASPTTPLPRDFVKAVGYRSYDAEAQVPFVPPAVKAKLRGGLHCYYTLFEAEWRKVPPRDPAILRHLGGPMYALLSVWDLTEVERLALSEYL